MALRRRLSQNGSLLNKLTKIENTDIPYSFAVQKLLQYRKEKYMFSENRLGKVKYPHIFLESIKLNKYRKE